MDCEYLIVITGVRIDPLTLYRIAMSGRVAFASLISAGAINVARTDHQIVDQTNDLARRLYRLRGYTVAEGYRFDKATHPHEVEAWRGACEAQSLLTGTDPSDALDNLDEG